MFAWQATVQDERGNAVLNPVVAVYESDGYTLAAIYNESGGVLDNPMTGTPEGFIQFWAEAGEYKIIGANGGDVTQEWSVFLDTPLTDAVNRAESARDDAEQFADDAENARDAAGLSAAQAALYDGPWLDSVAALLADTTLTYGPGAAHVQAGSIVRTRAEGFSYEVAAAGATDQHVTTAGGVKLYVLLTSDGWFPFDAMGWDKTGVADALSLLNTAIAYMKALDLVKIWIGSSGTLNLSADPTDYKFVYLAGQDITLAGNTSADFALHDHIQTYTTEAAAAGSTGGSGNNQSWKRVLSGSPAIVVFERTNVSPNPVVWGTLQANHDGFLISAGPTSATKKLILGVKAEQDDEGSFQCLSMDQNDILLNPARRDMDVRFYCQDRANAAVMNGITGEFTFNGGNAGSVLIRGNNTNSVARVGLINDDRNWEVRVHSDDEFRILDATAGVARMRISTGGEFGFGMAPTATIPISVAAGSYIFRGYDSAGTTNQITIQANGSVLNSTGTYGTISDERVKDGITDARSQWDDIKAVRLRNFRLKADGAGGPEYLGVVAQELIAAGMGGLVETTSDTDAEPLYAVKQSVLLMKALGALQEAMARIEALEAALADETP